MEEKFIAVWAANREKAESLGVRMRPIPAGEAMKTAHRALSGSRLSDGRGQAFHNTVQRRGSQRSPDPSSGSGLLRWITTKKRKRICFLFLLSNS